jgi:flagellar biosynthetic protein FliQ
MNQQQVLDVFRQAILVTFKLGGPLLLASIIIGLVIAVFQAATQIHEQTLTFVPKVFVIALMLLLLGSWMMTQMSEFMQGLFVLIANI